MEELTTQTSQLDDYRRKATKLDFTRIELESANGRIGDLEGQLDMLLSGNEDKSNMISSLEAELFQAQEYNRGLQPRIEKAEESIALLTEEKELMTVELQLAKSQAKQFSENLITVKSKLSRVEIDHQNLKSLHEKLTHEAEKLRNREKERGFEFIRLQREN